MKENIIHTAEDCNIKKFKACCYREKYSVLLIDGEATDQELKDAFEMIYAEYIDLAGLYTTREFELSAYIHSLEIRLQTVKSFIELQKVFIAEFGVPYVEGFGIVKKYGHHLYWDFNCPNKEAFLKKLESISAKEIKYKTVIANKVNELVDLRRKKVTKEHSLLESKRDFITMINRLQQARFVISDEDTSVESLALMIKDMREQMEDREMTTKSKPR